MNKTAIQQAIEQIKEKQNKYVPLINVAWHKYQECIDILTNLVPTEQEQMKGAWNDGHECGWQTANEENGSTNTMDSGAYSNSFEEYYNETYKTEE